MYVKKFEADSLDLALKEIKNELGPDAIILKTITNKGLKGALKKKKIEITAAISEKSYSKKSKVDRVLGEDHKNQFYKESASSVAQKIDNYNHASERSYGDLGVNRSVKKTNDLDSFLNTGPALPFSESELQERKENIVPERPREEDSIDHSRLLELEKELMQIKEKVANFDNDLPLGLKQLNLIFKSLDLSPDIIQKILKQARFELEKNELDDTDAVFDFAMRELAKITHVEMPLISGIPNGANMAQLPESESKTVTVFLSGGAVGQTSLILKLASLKDDVCVLSFGHKNLKTNFVHQLFGTKISYAKDFSEMIHLTKTAHENNQHVIIDYSFSDQGQDDSVHFIGSLKRSFNQVEVLVTLSAIHSEIYNRKVITKYRKMVDGICVSFIDQCLNYGALLNIQFEFTELPLKLFGTGKVVPDDIETASSERLLGGLLQL